ncbi:MAG: ABC transporter substrate-binding protein [Candidatus Binatia bacterium]
MTIRLWQLICVILIVCFLPGTLTAVDIAEVAILKSAPLTIYDRSIQEFTAALPKTTTTTEYNLQGDIVRGRQIAAKIRASSVGLVLAVGATAALAAKLEIFDTPVVYCMVLDPLTAGLTAPNVTGVSWQAPVELQLKKMHSLLPQRKRIGVLYDQRRTGGQVEEARRHATEVGFDLITQAVHNEKEVPPALRTLLSQVDVLWLLPDSTVLTEDSLRFFLGTALDANVPVIGFSVEQVRSGALAASYVDYVDVGKQTAALADALLRGGHQHLSSPLPPDRVRLALNLKTARFLDISIPPEVKDQADLVY